MRECERQILLAELRERNWNRSRTARQLGISERNLRYKLSKLQIAPPVLKTQTC